MSAPKTVKTEAEGAMVLADFFARKALEGIGEPTDALHAIRETLGPYITPLKDEDVAIIGDGEIAMPIIRRGDAS